MKEKIIEFENEGEKIKGILALPDRKTEKIVIIVHGFTATKKGPGNSFVKLAKKLAENGFAALRFNFRYTDENFTEFEKMTISSEVADLNLIIKKMKEEFKKIGLVGESLGATISILCYSNKIDCMVFWYPAIFLKETKVSKWLASKEALEELKLKGYVTGYKKSLGKYYKIGKDFVEEHKKLNLLPIIKKITCPVLLIHGDKDETVNLEQSKKGIKLFGSRNKKLEIIEGMGHAFWDEKGIIKREDFIDKAIELTIKWVIRWLK